MKKHTFNLIGILLIFVLSSLSCRLVTGEPAPTATEADVASPTLPEEQVTEPSVDAATQPPKTETAPPPTLIGGLAPGWHIYSNANHVRGLALHENTLWAAGLGGVVAWDLEAGQPTKYTTLDGMGYLGAYDIVVCNIPDLRIIVATEKGLNFFDPASGTWDSAQITPEASNVGDNKVDKLYCDQANNRLLIGYAGLGIYNFATGDWRQITEADGLVYNYVTDIAVIGADIWVTSSKGVSVIREGGIETYNDENGMPNQDARALAVGDDGALWFGTFKGLVRFKDGAWTLFNRENVPDFPRFSINALAFAPDGALWVATPFEDIAEFDPASQAVRRTFKEQSQKIVNDMLVDSAGKVYYSTSDIGLKVLQGETWQPLVIEADQLVSNFVASFGEDQDGLLWVGTNLGAQRLDPRQADQPWEVFRSNEAGPPSNQFQGIFPDLRRGMWFVHDSRWISFFDGNAWQRFGADQGISGYTADVAVSADGVVWIATNEGLVILEGETSKILTEVDGMPAKNVRSLLLDGDTLWIGTVDGLARLVNGSVEVVLAPKTPGLPDDNIGVIFKHPDGALLLGTPKGLARYDGDQVTTILEPEPLRTMFFGLTTQSISDIAIDPSGTLWVATYVGLYFGDGENWQRLTTLDGLPTNNINTLYVDPLGTLWVGGGYSNAGGGIARYVSDRR